MPMENTEQKLATVDSETKAKRFYVLDRIQSVPHVPINRLRT